MILFINCYLVFHCVMFFGCFFFFNNYVCVRYIKSSLGNRVATFSLGKSCQFCLPSVSFVSA